MATTTLATINYCRHIAAWWVDLRDKPKDLSASHYIMTLGYDMPIRRIAPMYDDNERLLYLLFDGNYGLRLYTRMVVFRHWRDKGFPLPSADFLVKAKVKQEKLWT